MLVDLRYWDQFWEFFVLFCFCLFFYHNAQGHVRIGSHVSKAVGWGIRRKFCTCPNTLRRHNPTDRSYASVTTRRTCYGSCVSGAAAELRLKFCVSCGWLGSESDSAATVPATHVSCDRLASDALNRTQKIPQRRHVQRTGAVPSRYLQRAFAVPPATCPYGGVRVCTSVARRRCVEGTTHVRRTDGLGKINQDFFIGWTKRVGQLRWLPFGATSPWQCVLITSHGLLSAPFISHFSCWQKHYLLLPYFGLRTFCWSWWTDRFPLRLFGVLPLRFGSHLLAELTITLGIISFKTINLWCYQLGKCRYHALR